jgi:hypothetical protein
MKRPPDSEQVGRPNQKERTLMNDRRTSAGAVVWACVMRVPAVVIRCEYEAVAPELLIDCLDEDEHDRLVDWIATQPGLGELIGLALGLGEAA